MFEAESWARNGEEEEERTFARHPSEVDCTGVMNMKWSVVNKDFDVVDKGNEVSRLSTCEYKFWG